MSKYDMSVISVNDVVRTLKECDRDWKYTGAVEHMVEFASELTGISADTLRDMMYPD